MNHRGGAALLFAVGASSALLVTFAFNAQRSMQSARQERREAMKARLRLVTKTDIGKVSEFFESGEFFLDCYDPNAPRVTWDPDAATPAHKATFKQADNSFNLSACNPSSFAEATRAQLYAANPAVPTANCGQLASSVKVTKMDCASRSIEVLGSTTDGNGINSILRARMKLTRNDLKPCPYFNSKAPESDPNNPANMIVFPQYNGWNAHNPVYYMFWGVLFSSSPFGTIASHSNRVVNPDYVAPNGRSYLRIQQSYFQRPGEPVTFDMYSYHQAAFATEVLIGPKDSPNCKVTQQLIGEWYWGGCLDARTEVTLSDGASRSLAELRPGDEVRNPITGKSTPIAAVLEPERKLPRLKIRTGSREILATVNHPVLNDVRVVAAGSLKVGDRIRMEDGKAARIESITAVSDPRSKMLNLRLASDRLDETSHLLAANGVVVGDLFLQRRLGPETDPRETYANRSPVLERSAPNLEWLP